MTWGKLLADVAAVGALLDRLLHHGHFLKCGPKSWRTKTAAASCPLPFDDIYAARKIWYFFLQEQAVWNGAIH